jgi:hypothetical protein
MRLDWLKSIFSGAEKQKNNPGPRQKTNKKIQGACGRKLKKHIRLLKGVMPTKNQTFQISKANGKILKRAPRVLDFSIDLLKFEKFDFFLQLICRSPAAKN